jgi:hypothetical protein
VPKTQDLDFPSQAKSLETRIIILASNTSFYSLIIVLLCINHKLSLLMLACSGPTFIKCARKFSTNPLYSHKVNHEYVEVHVDPPILFRERKYVP